MSTSLTRNTLMCAVTLVTSILAQAARCALAPSQTSPSYPSPWSLSKSGSPRRTQVGDGHFPADLLEAESPVPLRKLFGSPSPAAKTKKSPIQPAAAAAASPPRSPRSPRPTASSTPVQLNSACKASGSTRRGAALLGGLMGREEADALDKLVRAPRRRPWLLRLQLSPWRAMPDALALCP
eukprot:scaffold20054_cov125-Isochrysis_galbana.AAC.4